MSTKPSIAIIGAGIGGLALAGLLSLYHEILYAGHIPSPTLLVGMSAAALLVYLIGYGIFHRYASVFSEIV